MVEKNWWIGSFLVLSPGTHTPGTARCGHCRGGTEWGDQWIANESTASFEYSLSLARSRPAAEQESSRQLPSTWRQQEQALLLRSLVLMSDLCRESSKQGLFGSEFNTPNATLPLEEMAHGEYS